jgi:hypothetical protein
MIMKPVPVEKPRFRQPRAVMMLDDAEMALEMIDLAQTTTFRDVRRPPAAPIAPVHSADFYAELYAAASLIMDQKECEALVREFVQAERNHTLAA